VREKHGRVEEWKDGRVEGWEDGRMRKVWSHHSGGILIEAIAN
jgi:hypothetical protein